MACKARLTGGGELEGYNGQDLDELLTLWGLIEDEKGIKCSLQEEADAESSSELEKSWENGRKFCWSGGGKVHEVLLL